MWKAKVPPLWCFGSEDSEEGWKKRPRTPSCNFAVHKQHFCLAGKPPLQSTGHICSMVHLQGYVDVRLMSLPEGVCKGVGCVPVFVSSLQGVFRILREDLISYSKAINPWVKGTQVTSERHLQMDRGKSFSNGNVLQGRTVPFWQSLSPWQKFAGRRRVKQCLCTTTACLAEPVRHNTPEYACGLMYSQVPGDSWWVFADCLEDFSHFDFKINLS